VNTLHPEVLNESQLAILPALGLWATAQDFYLGGGTAVALYFGHRRSVDFDWFVGEGLRDPLVLAEHARERGLCLEDIRVAPGTLHALVDDVRVSFFDYPYPLITGLTFWPEYSVRLASLDDLACMKLAAIAQRGSRKDFIDLHAIALGHRPIQDILPLYRRKYSAEDIAHILVGLTYFDDADEEPMPMMLSDVSWDAMKQQFREWAKACAG
jgi:hypothetical protein